jgi:hypothetical protein
MLTEQKCSKVNYDSRTMKINLGEKLQSVELAFVLNNHNLQLIAQALRIYVSIK